MKRFLPILIIVGLILLVILGESMRPRPYDERLRVERDGVEPFDAQVFYRLLPEWLDAPVEAGTDAPYVRLADSTLVGTAYVFLTSEFAPDAAEVDRLMAYVARGNTVFVAAEYFEGPLTDAFSPDSLFDNGGPFGTDWYGSTASYAEELLEGNVFAGVDTLFLAEPSFGHRGGFTFPVDLGGQLFVNVDPEIADTLGTLASEMPSFLRIRHGAGQFLLSSTPLAFTNAVLTGEGDASAYVSAVLSYVPDVNRVLWDDHYKPFGAQLASRASYALETPPLRGALLLILLGAVLFIVFRGRRRQRPIPVVAPPPNAELEFARTVGRLYQIRGDTGWLARRRVQAFEDGLRTRLGIAEADMTDATAIRAAARAGQDASDTQALFQFLRNLRADPSPEARRLIEADRRVDAFFSSASAGARAGESDSDSPVASAHIKRTTASPDA